MAKPLLPLDPEAGAKGSVGLPGSMTPKPAAAMTPEAGLKAPAAHFGNATRTFRLAAERIAFALTVREVDLRRTRKLVAEPIEFTLTVQDATLRPQLADEIIMAAEPVAFTATVRDVALRQNHVLKAGAISYSIAVQDVLTVAPGEFVTTPEAHGWSDQNTVEQNTAAFQAAIDDASANASHSLTGRGVVELVQNKTYTVVQNSNGSTSNQTACLTALSDVEIRTAGKPTRSSGNHAVIQWESWSGKTGMHNRVLLRGDDISNFLIGWVTLHGNKNTADVDEINYGTGQDGGLHNMVFYGGQNIQMKELISTHALADGIYMRALNGTITDWLVEDCTFTRNRRQGLSAIKGGVSDGGWDQIVWRRCEFSESGDMPGDVLGHKPGAGVDMEPNQDSDNFYGWTFDDCDFKDNIGSDYFRGDDDAGHEGRGFVMDCRAVSAHMKWINCRSTGNYEGWHIGIRNTPTFDNFHFENLVIDDNDTQGDRFSIGSAGTAGGRMTNTVFINCDTPLIIWRSAAEFPAPWNAGWSVTIWKGDFNPTVTTQGITTITVNEGFPNGNGNGGNGGEPGEIENGGGASYTSNTELQNHDITVALGEGTNRKIAVIFAKDLQNRPINSATFDFGGDDEEAMTPVDEEAVSHTSIRGFWYDAPDSVEAGNKVIRVTIGTGNISASARVQWWKNVASGAPITNSTSDTNATGLTYALSDLPEGAVVFSGIIRSDTNGSFSPDDGQEELHEGTVTNNDHRAAFAHLIGASAGNFTVDWDDTASAPRVASLAMAWGPASAGNDDFALLAEPELFEDDLAG